MVSKKTKKTSSKEIDKNGKEKAEIKTGETEQNGEQGLPLIDDVALLQPAKMRRAALLRNYERKGVKKKEDRVKIKKEDKDGS